MSSDSSPWIQVNNMEDVPVIYVDGACRNNGQDNPQGGCGIYWGEYHPLNTWEYLIGDRMRQTLVWNSDTLQPFFLFIPWGIVGRHNVRHVHLLTFAVASL